ncbi:hypothetical protein LMIY3S_03375 [Labrys miyagiensis]
MRLDHFAWASASLERAVADLESWTGARAQAGGSHPGKGTRNAVLSLGQGLYLALDGPDPAQPLVDNNGAWMSKLDGYLLFLFAVATDDLEGAQRILADHGVTTQVASGERRTPSGRLIAWDCLVGGDPDFGSALPHVMRWKTDAHPSQDNPGDCRLAWFGIRHPRIDRVRRLYADLGLEGAELSEGSAVELRLTIQSPRGKLLLPTQPSAREP